MLNRGGAMLPLSSPYQLHRLSSYVGDLKAGDSSDLCGKIDIWPDRGSHISFKNCCALSANPYWRMRKHSLCVAVFLTYISYFA